MTFHQRLTTLPLLLSKLLQNETIIGKTSVRNFNCYTASIVKKHRVLYTQTYPTILVYPNGSSIKIRYHEPRRVIRLPLDVSTLSEEARQARIAKRSPKQKIVVQEEVDDIDFDESRYLKKY